MTGLTSYDVPLLATLETVPSSLFQNCKSLTAIDLPAAKELGINAIRGCDALESISLPNVEKVGNFCFAENPKLKEVDLPKATSLGTKAFDKFFFRKRKFLSILKRSTVIVLFKVFIIISYMGKTYFIRNF